MEVSNVLSLIWGNNANSLLGLALPINGTIVVAGKVAYVDTTGF